MRKVLLSLSILASLAFSAEDICGGLYDAGDYQKSGDCYVKQIKKSNSIANNYYAATSLLYQGRTKEALPYLQKAEQLASSEGDLILIYNKLSLAYGRIGNSELELAYNMKFLNSSLKNNNKSNISDAYNNLGLYYYRLGNYDKALEYYNKSFEFKEEKYRAIIYGNMAMVYDNLKNYDKAIEFYNKSIKIALDNGDYLGLCNTKTNLGTSLYDQEKYQEADKTLNEANAICHNAGRISTEANSLIYLGYSSIKQNDLPSAKSYYIQAKQLANKTGEIGILNNLAVLEKEINSYNK